MASSDNAFLTLWPSHTVLGTAETLCYTGYLMRSDYNATRQVMLLPTFYREELGLERLTHRHYRHT